MFDTFDIRDAHGATPELILCPHCNQPGFMNVWPAIVSTRDERAHALLLEGDLFKYICPVCGEKTTFAYDCLYHDVAHRTLILYSTGRHPESQCLNSLNNLADKAQWASGTQTPVYQKRIVSNPFQLCEKARILEQGYDDRIIELMKVALKRGMLKDGIIGLRDSLVYERTLDDGGISFVVFGEQPGDVVGVPQGYKFLEKHFAESDVPIAGEYRFDSDWANRFLP